VLHDHTTTVCQPHLVGLAGSDVHLWHASVDGFSPALESLYDVLTTDERRKGMRFVDDRRREQYIVGRGLLRSLAGSYLDCGPQEIVFAHNQFGKPYVVDASWLEFNVSHSHDMVVLAFARDRSVGIDVQRMDAHELTREFAIRVLSPDELSRLRRLDVRQRRLAFARAWVVKEAYVKGIGCGLSQPFNELEVCFAGDESPTLRSLRQDFGTSRWKLLELQLGEGYRAALAVDGHDWQLSSWSIDPISA
jgi:4'-phosphopantetheinyl transferase